MADKTPEIVCICVPLMFLSNYLQHALCLEAEILSVQKNFPTQPARDLSALVFHILKNTHDLQKSLRECISSFRQTFPTLWGQGGREKLLPQLQSLRHRISPASSRWKDAQATGMVWPGPTGARRLGSSPGAPRLPREWDTPASALTAGVRASFPTRVDSNFHGCLYARTRREDGRVVIWKVR